MTQEEIRKRILDIGIVPIVRASSATQARQAAEAVCAGGIPIVEVTMTVPGAIDVIQAGADALGIGGELVLPSALKSGDMKSISETARKFLAIVRDARTAKGADP